MIIYKEMKKVKTKKEAINAIVEDNLYLCMRHGNYFIKSNICKIYKSGHYSILKNKIIINHILSEIGGSYYRKLKNKEGIY